MSPHIPMSPKGLRVKCPRCSTMAAHPILADVRAGWREDLTDETAIGEGRFWTLQCDGCDIPFFHQRTRVTYDLETIDTPDGLDVQQAERRASFPPPPPPPPKTLTPPWLAADHQLDPALKRLMIEAYRAADAGLFSLAHMGLRAALEHYARITGADPDGDGNLEGAIKRLREAHQLGQADYDVLLTVKHAGDGAIHRGYAPTQLVFEQVSAAFVDFFRRAVVTVPQIQAIADTIPKRLTKRKQQPKP